MDPALKAAIHRAVENEPFVRTMGIRLVALDRGRAVVEMPYDPDRMANLFRRAHGGAVFALIDEAFETACQTEGTVVVALNVNVTYVAAPDVPVRLRAEARKTADTRKTATYDIRVTDDTGRLIAVCQALAYRTGKPLPFLETDH